MSEKIENKRSKVVIDELIVMDDLIEAMGFIMCVLQREKKINGELDVRHFMLQFCQLAEEMTVAIAQTLTKYGDVKLKDL